MSGATVTLGKLAITESIRKSTKGMIFFLHGACDNGNGMKNWLNQILKKDFKFRNNRVIYPTAPSLPYTAHGGKETTIWYDHTEINPKIDENLTSLNATLRVLSQLIRDKSSRHDIPMSKIIVGGFSIGGSAAMHLGFRLHTEIAGVFVLSSFLPNSSIVYSHLDRLQKEDKHLKIENDTPSQLTLDDPFSIEDSKMGESATPVMDKIIAKAERSIVDSTTIRRGLPLPQLFMTQGSADPVVKTAWAKSTFTELRKRGVEGYFHTIPNHKHSINYFQLNLLHAWIRELLFDGYRTPKLTAKKPYHPNDNIAIPVD